MDTAITTLDLEDLNAKQLRKLIKGMSISQKPHHDRPDKDKEEDLEKATKENEDAVDLHREKKGDSKPPKVEKDDLSLDDKEKGDDE